MRVYEFSKKFDVAIKDIVGLLKERGVRRASPDLILSDPHILFLQKRFRVGIVQEQAAAVTVDADIEEKDMLLGELSEKLGRPASEVIVLLLRKGVVANKNQLLKKESVAFVVKHYGATLIAAEEEVNSIGEAKEVLKVDKKSQALRAPVVVIVGHVDHGKTTLLDYIRKTKVASGEAGGITQHLGAYGVETKQGKVVFLDTPGHEAFSLMRERGVRVADIVALIVAADDGVKPQTIESIKVVQKLKLPMIVVINKVDKVDPARIEVVKRQLADLGILSDEWGGDVPFALISAAKGEGVDSLLDLFALQAEMLELTTNLKTSARGYVLESRIQKGRGAVASVLLHCGQLSVGDYFVCGRTQGKVSSMVDSSGKAVRKIGPSEPVEVAGFVSIPGSGDLFQVATQIETKKHKSRIDADVETKKRVDVSVKAINVLVKASSFSSRDAVVQSLEKIKVHRALPVRIIEAGIGDINENNIELAEQANAIILGLDVKIGRNVLALKSEATVKLYNIIYKLVDDIKEMVEKTKQPEYIETNLGKATVKAVFRVKSSGVIAGAAVQEGVIKKGELLSVYRDNKKLAEGEIRSLQRDKQTAATVAAGLDCAFRLNEFEGWKIGDEVYCFSREEKK